MKGAFIEDLAWPQVSERLAEGAVVLVPIGAAAKEHGHHLPMGTDAIQARALAERVAEQLPVLVAPVVGFGYYPVFTLYPGSQHLRAETFIALIEDLLDTLITQGATRIALLNTGVSTEGPLRIATDRLFERTGVRVITADIRALGRAADDLLEQRVGGHADERETSVMLVLRPDLVAMEKARTDYGDALDAAPSVFVRPLRFRGDPDAGPDHSETGAFGDPTLASAEKGARFLQAMVDDLVRGLRRDFPEAFD